MKRTSAIAAVTAAALALSLAACGSADSAAASSAPAESTAASTEAASSEAPASEAAPAGDFDADQDITVISREDGSGTRGAFIELTGVEEKNADGKKVDNTTEAAAIQSSTNGVMTAVANDETAIGYISLGSLSNDVKAVTVGGVEASAETVKDGSYVLSRPFNIVTNGDATDPVAVDFIAYVLSKDGQAIATDNGYIGEDGADFTSAQPEGKIVVGGSSSVSPLMEKLIEAYKTVNPNAELELQTTDSTTGVSGALEGTYTIGMASRELKDSEVEGVDGNSGITQHRLGAGRGQLQHFAGLLDGVEQMPEAALLGLILDLGVGNRGVAVGAPVDHAVAAVDQPLVVQTDKDLLDGVGAALIHREALALPVAGAAQLLQLADDAVAIGVLPVPGTLQKAVAAHHLLGQALLAHLGDDLGLGGNGRMVGAGHPQRGIALHPLVAGQDVLPGLIHGVAHVQLAGDVRRRHDDVNGFLLRSIWVWKYPLSHQF